MAAEPLIMFVFCRISIPVPSCFGNSLKTSSEFEAVDQNN